MNWLTWQCSFWRWKTDHNITFPQQTGKLCTMKASYESVKQFYGTYALIVQGLCDSADIPFPAKNLLKLWEKLPRHCYRIPQWNFFSWFCRNASEIYQILVSFFTDSQRRTYFVRFSSCLPRREMKICIKHYKRLPSRKLSKYEYQSPVLC